MGIAERIGDGPVEGSVVLQKADYGKLKEVTTPQVGPGPATVSPSEP